MDVPSYLLGKNAGGGSHTETDPTVPNYVKGITQQNITDWDNKQDELVSGTNIKTINNESILGSGNIEIQGGGGDSFIHFINDNSQDNPLILENLEPGIYYFINSNNRVYIKGTESKKVDYVSIYNNTGFFIPKKYNETSNMSNFAYYTTFQFSADGNNNASLSSKTLVKSESSSAGYNVSDYRISDYNNLFKKITGYKTTTTQVLKNVNGTLTWIDE